MCVRLIRVPAKLDVYDNGYPYQTVTVNKLTWRDAVDLHGPGHRSRRHHSTHHH